MMPIIVRIKRLRAKSHWPEASITDMTVTSVSPMVSPIFSFMHIMITRIQTKPTEIG